MASPLATTSSDSRLGRAWARLAQAGRRGLVPYLTAGFPSVEVSRQALAMAAEVGDVVEVGVPFSDPLADGPTIQRSTFAALENGMTLPRTLELISSVGTATPIVLFSYLNPILQYGVERLVRDAAGIGVAGILVTDLPAGADPGIEGAISDSELDLVRLIAPTSTPERIRAAVAGAQGFVYLVARLGVTGASAALAEDLAGSIARVRTETALPIAVGFGISTPDQVRAVGHLADGVVVGSAFVDALARGGLSGATTFLTGLRQALDAV